MYTSFHREIHDCHSGFDGRNTENIELSLSEILPVKLVDRLYVSCSYRRQILHIWSGLEATENQLLYVENLPWSAAEFGKLARGIWKNLPRKTVVLINRFLSVS